MTATAPTAELTRYAVDLRALTGGRGSFSVDLRPLRHRARAPDGVDPPAGELNPRTVTAATGRPSEEVLEAHRDLGQDQRAQQLVARRRHHGHGQRAGRTAEGLGHHRRR